MGTILELILENFMSHSYSRIPLKQGLNLVCGPNGAGKSSILLGLSVALGQTYTERSRRLSDLIQRGKDLARVSVVFDNSPQDGKRPLPGFNSDTVVLSRYLSRDGTYWHEINSRGTTKGELLRFLRHLSLNPDNMLIIMHQNMVDTFGAIDMRERLKLVEEAVGLHEYRENILSAMQKLSHTLSEEEAVKRLLEKAEETLRYWEGEYQRLKRKRELERRKVELEAEYRWSRYLRKEEELGELEAEMEELQNQLTELRTEAERERRKGGELEGEVGRLEFELEASYEELIAGERLKAEGEVYLSLAGRLSGLGGDLSLPSYDRERVEAKIGETRGRIARLKGELSEKRKAYVETRVREALLELRQDLLRREMDSLSGEIRRARRELEVLRKEAEGAGERVETKRKPQEVLEELKVVGAHLSTLGEVSPEVEQMYLNYRATMEELRERARVAEENRKKALEEVEERKRRWRREVEKLLGQVREEYVKLLERVNARGDLKLVNPEDIEGAGLELYVGFRGTSPQLLDAYTQSGGERTTAIMFFLLALQKQIKSPLRAIDEFETHLDPRNREAIFRSIIEATKGERVQYLVITPGYLLGVEEVPNIVMVQNVGGTSQVRVVTSA
ncbi:MAG: AAA family ATPase [Candidatus Hadarchaeales archaeon]